MPSFIAVIVSFFFAVSVAVAADPPASPAGEPWWSNPPATLSPGQGPKDNSAYGSASATDSGTKATERKPPDRAVQSTEFAPDPPGLRHADTLPVVFEQDLPPATEMPAASTRSEKAKAAERARDVLPKPVSPPRRLSETAPAASSASRPSAASTSPAATSSASTAQSESAITLGQSSHNDKNAPTKGSPLAAVITVGGSLAIVLGLFFLVAWVMRKTAPRGSLVLPKEVLDILGRAHLGARQQVQLLRFGNKLLLVSITPNGTETLTEVTDPMEVDRIAGVCQQAHPKSTTTAFRQVFQQLAPKSGEPAELDNLEPVGTRRKRYRWEEKHA